MLWLLRKLADLGQKSQHWLNLALDSPFSCQHHMSLFISNVRRLQQKRRFSIALSIGSL